MSADTQDQRSARFTTESARRSLRDACERCSKGWSIRARSSDPVCWKGLATLWQVSRYWRAAVRIEPRKVN